MRGAIPAGPEPPVGPGPTPAGFEAGQFDPADFDHRAHVCLAWCYLRQYGLAEAIQRFTGALRVLTERLGQSAKYHETVSWFFMIQIANRRSGPAADIWDRFVDENPDLLNRGTDLLRHYYSSALLDSDRARQLFQLPDLPRG